MKFPNLHTVWTAGKNLALPDTLSRNTPPELLTRKTTVEIPKNIKFYLAENETSPRLECKYAVKTNVEQSQINSLQHFPLYLDCQIVKIITMKLIYLEHQLLNQFHIHNE